MAQLYQMLGCQPGPGDVVDPDGVNKFAGVVAVDQDDRYFHSGEPLEIESADARGHHQNPVHAALLQGVDRAQLPLRVGVTGGENEGVVVSQREFLNAADHFSANGSAIVVTTTPIVLVLFVTRLRPTALTLYPASPASL